MTNPKTPGLDRTRNENRAVPSSPLGWMTEEVGQSLKPEDLNRVFGSAFQPKKEVA